MAGIANRKRTGELMRKLFEILLKSEDGMKAAQALKALERALPATKEEDGNYKSGGRKYEIIVRFCTVDTTKAGWLQKAKGRWTVTDAGRAAFEQYKDPETFYSQAIELYHEWKRTQPDVAPDEAAVTAPATGHADEPVGKTASITFEEAEELAWTEVERYLRAMDPYDFQELVGSLLKAMGFHVTWISPPGPDGGFDIVAFAERFGTSPHRIKVQVKRQKDSVSVDGLRSFLAVLSDDDVGIFVNTGGFTSKAATEARMQEKRRITLIDMEALFDLWVEHYQRLSDDARRRLPLKPIYFFVPGN